MKPTKRKRESIPAADAPEKVKAASENAVVGTAEQVIPELTGATAGGKATTEPVIVMAEVCSLKDAAALKNSLCALAGENAPVTLDARNVERVDTATMQLLCAFVRDRAARDQKVVWLGDSQALQEAAWLLGVSGLLALSQKDSRSDHRGAAA